MPVTHAFVSLVADGADTALVRPGDWNADHVTPSILLAQGTITDPALNLSSTVTWNDAADTFTAWKLNVTNTNSAAASLLMDLQVDGTSQFTVRKDGLLTTVGGLDIDSDAGLLRLGASQDVILARDAANTLALRNGTTPQFFSAYNTITDVNNYERFSFGWSGNVAEFRTNAAGSGTLREIQFVPSSIMTVTAGAGGAATLYCGQFATPDGSGNYPFALLGDQNKFGIRDTAVIGWTSNQFYNGTVDLRLSRDEPGVLYVVNPNATGAAIQSTEWASGAPGTPPSTGWVLYAVDNGGKTELLVKWDDGSTSQVAIQP